MSSHPDRQHPEQNKMYRVCPTYKTPCFSAQCEHVCFLDDKYDEPEERGKHESLHCPETGLHCTDHLCSESFCVRKHHKDKRDSDRFWDELMRKLSANPFNYHSDPKEIFLKIVAEQVGIIDRLTRNAEHKRERPIFALLTLINKTQFIMADIKIVAGTPVSGLFALLDNKTLAPLTGVIFSNQAVGFNTNPEIATFSIDGDGKLAGANVTTSGSGKVTVTTDAAYTDLGDNSAQSGSFSVIKNFTVVPSLDGVTFEVIFS